MVLMPIERSSGNDLILSKCSAAQAIPSTKYKQISFKFISVFDDDLCGLLSCNTVSVPLMNSKGEESIPTGQLLLFQNMH